MFDPQLERDTTLHDAYGIQKFIHEYNPNVSWLEGIDHPGRPVSSLPATIVPRILPSDQYTEERHDVLTLVNLITGTQNTDMMPRVLGQHESFQAWSDSIPQDLCFTIQTALAAKLLDRLAFMDWQEKDGAYKFGPNTRPEDRKATAQTLGFLAERIKSGLPQPNFGELLAEDYHRARQTEVVLQAARREAIPSELPVEAAAQLAWSALTSGRTLVQAPGNTMAVINNRSDMSDVAVNAPFVAVEAVRGYKSWWHNTMYTEDFTIRSFSQDFPGYRDGLNLGLCMPTLPDPSGIANSALSTQAGSSEYNATQINFSNKSFKDGLAAGYVIKEANRENITYDELASLSKLSDSIKCRGLRDFVGHQIDMALYSKDPANDTIGSSIRGLVLGKFVFEDTHEAATRLFNRLPAVNGSRAAELIKKISTETDEHLKSGLAFLGLFELLTRDTADSKWLTDNVGEIMKAADIDPDVFVSFHDTLLALVDVANYMVNPTNTDPQHRSVPKYKFNDVIYGNPAFDRKHIGGHIVRFGRKGAGYYPFKIKFSDQPGDEETFSTTQDITNVRTNIYGQLGQVVFDCAASSVVEI